ncbi:uncharacterized protein [Branchiostoma lanceolatum]|uniref:uncharacterized protein n=1 Tax=Branchiostoma lanceolatum TaxID=7740 RepID=UPI00345122CC
MLERGELVWWKVYWRSCVSASLSNVRGKGPGDGAQEIIRGRPFQDLAKHLTVCKDDLKRSSISTDKTTTFVVEPLSSMTSQRATNVTGRNCAISAIPCLTRLY